jgi:hypothetical protein
VRVEDLSRGVGDALGGELVQVAGEGFELGVGGGNVTVHRPDIFIDAWQWDPRQPGSREGGGRPWRAASQALVT